MALLHLTIPYTTLTKQLIPLTRTLPLTLHNLEPTQRLFHEFFAGITPASTTESSGLDGVLVLYSKWFETISEEGLPYLVPAARDLLRIGALNGLQAVLIEKTYSTLSAIFKTMAPSLVATTAPRQTIDDLWTECAPYLVTTPAVKPHVRACVAQAWAVILRRARGDVAKHLIGVMVRGMEHVGERGVASTLSEGMKGAQHLLHSRATQLYALLIEHLGENEAILGCMVFLTTSLIHHASATAMAPIHALVIRQLQEKTVSTATLRLAATLVSVRKGMRLPPAAAGEQSALQQYMYALVSLLPQLATRDRPWRTEFLRLLTASLVAGKLGDWLSPGVKLIDAVWDALPIDEKFAWTAALVRLKWKGVEQFLLHHVARTSISSLETHRLETISLLATLAKAGFLDKGMGNVQGGRWKELLGKAVADLFTRWAGETLSEDEYKCVARIFTLCAALAGGAKTFLGPMRALLVTLRETAVAMTPVEARAAFAAGPFTVGHVLACGLDCLAKMDDAGVQVDEAVKDVVGDGLALVEMWGWHRQVLQGLAGVRTHWVDAER